MTDRPAYATNCVIEVGQPLVRVEREVAEERLGQHIGKVPLAAMARKLGMDDTYEHLLDACTDSIGGSSALEIIVYRKSLCKLGEISLFEDHRFTLDD